jgi:hypothetical protein
MRVAPWVRPFLLCWVGFASTACLVSILLQVLAREFFLFGSIDPLVMTGIGGGVLQHLPRGFIRRTERELRYLADLVEASEVPRANVL